MPKITIRVEQGKQRLSGPEWIITATDSNGNVRIRQFTRDERDATHRAFGMSVVFGAFYDQLRYTVDEQFDTLKHIGVHPAEARSAELAAQLATAQAEIGRLNQQLAQIVINSVRMP